MTLDNYENYTLFYLDYGVWMGYSTTDILHIPWYNSKYKCCRICNDDALLRDLHMDCNVSKLKEHSLFAFREYTFEEGDTLYFYEGCKIPHKNGAWKITHNRDKADAVVVPMPRDINFIYEASLFQDDVDKRIYFVHRYGTATKDAKEFIIGETIMDALDRNRDVISEDFFKRNINGKDAFVEKLKRAKCIYNGPICCYHPSSRYIFEILAGANYNIIWEKDLMNSLPTQTFTMENVESLKDMLSSSDVESISLGLRTLAAMDYAHYPSVTKYILRETHHNWNKYSLNINTAVRFMLNYLEYSKYIPPFHAVTAEEFELAAKLFMKFFNKEVNKAISQVISTTNMHTVVDTNTELWIDTPDGKKRVNELNTHAY